LDHSKQLGEEKITRLLIKFSVPAVVGMLVNALYNIVDRIFVGRGVGDLAIAGITISFPVILITMAFAMLIGMGATSLISLRLGEQKKKEAELVMGNALVLLILVTSTLSVWGLLFLYPLLEFLGASGDVLPYAADYLSIILIGTIIMGIGLGMNNFIRAEGNPKIAMYTMLIGAIINIVLDPLFIFGFNMGIRGAALATIIAQSISAVWVLHYFLAGDSLLKIRRENLRIKSSVVRNIIAIGFPMFALQVTNSVQQTILNKSLSIYGGDIAVAAMGILFSLGTLIIMPIVGINQGVQPIIGYNYGARQFYRVKEAVKLSVLIATVTLSLGFVVTRLFPGHLIGMFNSNPQLVKVGTQALIVFFLFLPVIGIQIITSGYFQAVGKPIRAAFLSLSRQILLFIPALLIFPVFWGLNGIWWAAPFSDLGSSLIAGLCLFFELRRLEIQQKESRTYP
jgi:putative MATE family efflux protein